MVHEGQRLPLGLEAGDHVARVHAGLDDLQRDLAADGLLLLGDEDEAHAAFADLLHQLVRADDRAGPLGNGRLVGRENLVERRRLEERADLGMGAEQALDALTQLASSTPHARSR